MMGLRLLKEIELEDPYENMGAKLVQEVANKTNEIAGDGTTTATVLAQSMIQEGLKNVTSGANPVGLRQGIDKAVKVAVEALHDISQKVENKNEIAQVGVFQLLMRKSVNTFLRRWIKLATTGLLLLKNQMVSTLNLKSLKVCSSIVVINLHIW